MLNLLWLLSVATCQNATTIAPSETIQVDITGATELQLPENELTFKGDISRNGLVNETWNWKWEVMERPDSSDDIEIGGITTKKLHLSKLIAGGYTLSLEVNNDKENKRGNGTFHFNVLEAKKVNHPPRAIISDLPAPILPDTKVFLIGSKSSDPDDHDDYHDIVKYEWEMVEGNFQEDDLLKDVNLEQADIELVFTQPRNYTFELTVTDAEGVSDSTQTTVVIEEEPDSPPIANAGKAMSINLPTDQVTLCGNSSTDDKGIISWVWSPDNQNEHSTDLIHVHEKCLTVSAIQWPGIYKFNLKVCDEAKQCDQASVQVKVNERINVAPVGALDSPSIWTNEQDENVFYISTNQGQSCVLQLDACESSDENDDLTFEFNQVTTIETITIKSEGCKAEVKGIDQEAQLTFEVIVTDTGKPPLSDIVTLNILVKLAQPPVVVVEKEIQLNQDTKYIAIDASDSFAYDHSTLSFDWMPLDESSATFTILNGSMKKNRLELINFAPGQLKFNLTVTDGQSQSSSELVRLIVNEADAIGSIIETRSIPCQAITYLDRTNIRDELLINLKPLGVITISIIDIYIDHATGDLIVLFVPYQENHIPLSPKRALPVLLDSFHSSGFKSFCKSSSLHIKAYVCLADCNHHGQCNNGTNTCECDPFWMASPFDPETNCAWSVLYFTLTTIGLTVLTIISGFSFKSVLERKHKKSKKQKRRKNTRYEQLHQESDSEENYKEMHRLRRKKRRKRQETKKT